MFGAFITNKKMEKANSSKKLNLVTLIHTSNLVTLNHTSPDAEDRGLIGGVRKEMHCVMRACRSKYCVVSCTYAHTCAYVFVYAGERACLQAYARAHTRAHSTNLLENQKGSHEA